MSQKTKVVLVQLGSPKTPAVKDVRAYLQEFLGDPRVVDINPILWKCILYGFVLPFRPARSAKLYSRIWDGKEFPLISYTREFAESVQNKLNGKTYEVDHAFLLSSPRIGDVWDNWEKDVNEGNDPATELFAVAMFPQYSESTVASGMDKFAQELGHRTLIPPFRFLTDFHRAKAFIDNSVLMIEKKLHEFRVEKSIDALVISFHGIPKRRVVQKADPYYRHCYETFALIKRGLQQKGVIGDESLHMTFQSRFGSEEWLTPYTDDYVENLIASGQSRVAVYCPSFVADCLETVDEIGHELREDAEQWGGEICFIPCLNTDEKWCEDFAELVRVETEGSREERQEQYYELTKEEEDAMEEPQMETPPLSPEAKNSLKIMFLTLFLDLVSFSIIFPLFPALAKHYLAVDPDNIFLVGIFETIHQWFTMTDGDPLSMRSVVLFGGALGALYSFLQFVAAPLWGSLSDRIGRKPVLMISIFGLALSYLLWFFSGSFTLLILARFIGGIMGGNISTATAVVADVTRKENRSKGMAIIGIAFAFGFILGPALGGIFSLIDLTSYYPTWKAWGVNPFSMPAFIAFVLSSFNFFFIWKRFSETLPEEKRGLIKTSERVINPVKLFKPLPIKGVNTTNFSNFFFLTAFSGMEFTLTFLAVERLSYSSFDNAKMFIFIGFIIALVQGGFVRRKAHQIGERKLTLMGMLSVIPGLLCIAYTQSSWLLYLGLFFLAVGSSMVIPCLTGLASLYSPVDSQGKSIGIFRSLGALARVFGPILASIIYWQMSSGSPYLFGAAFMLIPIALVLTLPHPEQNAPSE